MLLLLALLRSFGRDGAEVARQFVRLGPVDPGAGVMATGEAKQLGTVSQDTTTEGGSGMGAGDTSDASYSGYIYK